MELKEIETQTYLGMKTWAFNEKLRIRKYYVKFSLFGFINWGDFLDPNFNEWNFLGFKLK